jgi:hypothetical protein
MFSDRMLWITDAGGISEFVWGSFFAISEAVYGGNHHSDGRFRLDLDESQKIIGTFNC